MSLTEFGQAHKITGQLMNQQQIYTQ